MSAVTSTVALPRVADLSKVQRDALLVELVKAHFADAGMPWYFTVRDGDKLLGIFHPEFHRPEVPTSIEFPPEFIEEVKRGIKDIDEGRAKVLTSDEFLNQVELELDRMHRE